MALPTSFENLCLPFLEIIENKGRGHSTNFAGIYSNISQKLNLNKSEIDAEIEENIFAVKEMLKLVRDSLLGAGWLKGNATSFELSTKGRAFLKLGKAQKVFDFSTIDFDVIYDYYKYQDNRTFNVTVNEIEYTAKGWERKVFKFAEDFNLKSKIQKIKTSNKELLESTKIDNEIPKTKKNLNETICELNENNDLQIKKDLLNKLKSIGPFEFEKLTVNVVCFCLYGEITDELIKEVAKVTKKTGDGGIDGIVIQNNKMGERTYYIQAKKYTGGSVGSKEIDSFFAALSRKGASDGLLITTSTFSKPALETIKEFKEKAKVKIKAINGEELVELMLEHKIGTTHIMIKLKEIDDSYFLKLK
jgi:restriction endonuclease Mrr